LKAISCKINPKSQMGKFSPGLNKHRKNLRKKIEIRDVEATILFPSVKCENLYRRTCFAAGGARY